MSWHITVENIIQFIGIFFALCGFIAVLIRQFGTGKQVKKLYKQIETDRLEFNNKEKELSAKIVELKFIIKQNEYIIKTNEDLMRLYKAKLTAYEQKNEKIYFEELEKQLAKSKEDDNRDANKIMELQKELELAKQYALSKDKEIEIAKLEAQRLGEELKSVDEFKQQYNTLAQMFQAAGNVFQPAKTIEKAEPIEEKAVEEPKTEEKSYKIN
ncbi:hypothetical protein [Mycoplasma simbae]|uniref:hypothetical protein n=1 Tax=Mycoplasma simbae TaxID=36744 RepID=UPI000497D79A|nr:hypothetical protein [Mycoplasma simbae]